MQVSRKIKMAILVASCAFFSNISDAYATETLLASVDMGAKAENIKAELWGEVFTNGYAKNLTILLKNNNRLLTAYNPDIQGGYNYVLIPVQVKPVVKDKNNLKEEVFLSQQLLIGVGQGNWNENTEYRILDFNNPEAIEELFVAKDSMGILNNVEDNGDSINLKFLDGQQNQVNIIQNESNKNAKLRYGGLFSLTPYDIDGDGQQELLSTQYVKKGHQILADIGAVWQLQEKDFSKNKSNQYKWSYNGTTIMLVSDSSAKNTINNGKDCSYGVILPKKMIIPDGEATYPIFTSKNVNLQNKINKLLASENKEYLQKFYNDEGDMAFRVVRNDELLLTIQLISGKETFQHHHINIDPTTGNLVKLEEIIDVNNKDLYPLLQILCTNKKIIFQKEVFTEWYIEGNNLFLIKNVDGREEIAGFALANLHKYILDKKWLK